MFVRHLSVLLQLLLLLFGCRFSSQRVIHHTVNNSNCDNAFHSLGKQLQCESGKLSFIFSSNTACPQRMICMNDNEMKSCKQLIDNNHEIKKNQCRQSDEIAVLEFVSAGTCPVIRCIKASCFNRICTNNNGPSYAAILHKNENGCEQVKCHHCKSEQDLLDEGCPDEQFVVVSAAAPGSCPMKTCSKRLPSFLESPEEKNREKQVKDQCPPYMTCGEDMEKFYWRDIATGCSIRLCLFNENFDFNKTGPIKLTNCSPVEQCSDGQEVIDWTDPITQCPARNCSSAQPTPQTACPPIITCTAGESLVNWTDSRTGCDVGKCVVMITDEETSSTQQQQRFTQSSTALTTESISESTKSGEQSTPGSTTSGEQSTSGPSTPEARNNESAIWTQQSMLHSSTATPSTNSKASLTSDQSVNQETPVQPGSQSTMEPATQTTMEPAAQTTMEPSDQTTMEPMEQTTMEPLEQKTMEPLAQTTMEPLEQTTMEPLAQTTMEPLAQTTMEPLAQTTMEPLAQTTMEPLAQTTMEPLAQTTMEPSKTTDEKSSKQESSLKSDSTQQNNGTIINENNGNQLSSTSRPKIKIIFVSAGTKLTTHSHAPTQTTTVLSSTTASVNGTLSDEKNQGTWNRNPIGRQA